MNGKKFHWGFIFAPLYTLMGFLSLWLGRSRRERFHTVTGFLWLVLATGWACIAAKDLNEEPDDWEDEWDDEWEETEA